MKYKDVMDIVYANKRRNKDIDDNKYVEAIYDEYDIPHFKDERRAKRR